MNKLLFTDKHTYEEIQDMPDTEEVIYNLHEDILCVQEENQALRNELEAANTEVERLRLLYKDTAIALVLKGGKVDVKSIHKDINKIKADAICDLADNYVNGPITAELTVEYIYEYANKLEQGK